jgi:hypothetical protein
MRDASRPSLQMIEGCRDEFLVHIGSTGSNKELEQLVSRLTYRAVLRSVDRMENQTTELEGEAASQVKRRLQP